MWPFSLYLFCLCDQACIHAPWIPRRFALYRRWDSLGVCSHQRWRRGSGQPWPRWACRILWSAVRRDEWLGRTSQLPSKPVWQSHRGGRDRFCLVKEEHKRSESDPVNKLFLMWLDSNKEKERKYIWYSSSTNRKYPLGFLLRICMAFSVISTMEGSRVLFRNTSNLMSFGSNRPGITENQEVKRCHVYFCLTEYLRQSRLHDRVHRLGLPYEAKQKICTCWLCALVEQEATEILTEASWNCL